MAAKSLQRDVPSPELIASVLVWILSLAGGLLSVFLTVAKFRSAFRCDESLLSACGSWFDCGRVLTSARSQLFNVPISVFSTSYYVLLLGLATAILVRPARNFPIVGPMMSWLAIGGAAAVAYLAVYARIFIHSTCGYCMAVYAIQLVILLAVWLMHPGGVFSSLVAVWSRLRTRGSIALIAVLGFVALSSSQMVLYRRGSASMQVEPRCIIEGRSLPETTLHTEAPAAAQVEVEVGLFVDLACPACRTEFLGWLDDARASGGKYQVSVFHYARESGCIPPNFPAASADSLYNHSCDAALAVECVAKLVADREPDPDKRPAIASITGLNMMRLLFAHQSDDAPYFTQTRLAAAARQLGVDADPDRKREEDPFFSCLDDPAMRTRIVDHARFGMSQNLMETPGAFFRFYDGHVPSDHMLLFRGAKTYGDVETLMSNLRAQLEQRG